MATLALPPIPAGYAGPEVIASTCSPCSKALENAGWAFLVQFESGAPASAGGPTPLATPRGATPTPGTPGTPAVGGAAAAAAAGGGAAGVPGTPGTPGSTATGGTTPRARQPSRAARFAAIEAAAAVPLPDRNHYAVLGLEDECNSSDDEIRRAYRKLIVRYHPDKAGNNAENRASNHVFLAIQKAFDLLSDPAQRREYDSNFDFDDSIPSGKEDIDCPEDFFDLYRPVFKRNARFSKNTPVPDLGTVDTPYEEVQMFYSFWFKFESWREFTDKDEYDPAEATSRDERRWMQAQNSKQRAKLKRADVARMNNLATRAFAIDPRIKAHKEAERERKLAQRREREREEEAARAAEAERAQAVADAAKREADAKKAAKKAAKQRLREARSAVKRSGTELLTEPALEGMEEKDVIALCSAWDAERLEALVPEISGEDRAAAAEALRAAITEVQEEEAAKAKSIADKLAMRSRAAKAAACGPEWSAEELSALARAMSKFPGGTMNRWQIVADTINTLGLDHRRSKDECIAKADELRRGTARAGAGTAAAAAGGDASPAAAAADEWSAEQQAALEAALRKYPALMDKKERWSKIEGDVPGKTRKQCIQRFKWIREQLKKKAGK